jgi:hypothetical protein
VKYELLFIPFFSWCVLAFGGVPINRKKIDQAIQAMAEGIAAASACDVVTVSPEGTRSTSGQLLPFKKGPFHLWKQLDNCPVVPIVNFGAFELYPTKRLFTLPGKVYLRYLTPIRDDEKKLSREEMNLLLRKRMLESLKDVPADAGANLSQWKRFENVVLNILNLSWHLYLWKIIPFRAIKRSFGLTRLQVYGLLIFGSVFMTIAIYVYLYYLVHWVGLLYSKLFPRKLAKVGDAIADTTLSSSISSIAHREKKRK